MQTNTNNHSNKVIDKKMDMHSFLLTHKLPDNYEAIAQKWFEPLCETLLESGEDSAKPFIIGVSGCQGSGKTTLSSYLVEYLMSVHDKKVVSISIDDFYLNQADRLALAKNIHPLLKTRGVPGTHDMSLALSTFTHLQNGTNTPLPRFDKATDNPYPVEQWSVVNSIADFIILEGWCVSVTPQSEKALKNPINALEEKYDSDGIWRSFVNTELAGDYQTLFDLIDYSVFLKAPSFDCVFNWRLEQEQKLANTNHDGKAVMTKDEIATFIQHYERLTQHALQTLPTQSDAVFFLDNTRSIIKQKILQ